MENSDGRSLYKIELDTTHLSADAKSASGMLSSIGDTAIKEGNRIENAFSSVGTQIGMALGAIGVGGFVKKMFEVRSELQATEKSFEVLTGSVDKAKEVLAELTDYAVISPLSQKDVNNTAQMLMAFNISADETVSVIKQLGDVAMGDSSKFQSLSLAFAQMSSLGKVVSQDLRQMATAGFNPLVEISAKLGISTEEANDMLSDGRITIDMVKDAFVSATSEGGKFYKMTEKQAAGLQGKMANLQASIVSMFDELGTSSEDTMGGVLDFASSTVEHYKEIGEVIVALVGTYGLYKAALITTAAANKAAQSVQYSLELQELKKLLPAKKESAHATIEQAVATGKLSQAQGAEIIKIREEIMANIEAAKVELAKARQATINSAKSLKETQAGIAATRAKIAALEQEKAALTSSGNINKVHAINERLSTESTKLKTLATREKTLATDLATAREATNTKATKINTMTQGLSTAALTAGTKAKGMAAIATNVLSKAWKSFTASLMANPIMLIAAALGALVYGIYKLATAESAAEKQQRQYNEQLKKSEELQREQADSLNNLISVIRDENAAQSDRNKAYAELQATMEKFPELMKGMNFGDIMKMNAKETNEFIASINKATEAMQLQELQKLASELDAERRSGKGNNLFFDTDLEKQIEKRLKDLYGDTYSNADDIHLAIRNLSQKISDDKRAIAKSEEDMKLNGMSIDELKKFIDNYKKLRTEYDAILKLSEEEQNKIDYKKFYILEEDIDKYIKRHDELTEKEKASAKYNKAYWEEQKKMQESVISSLETTAEGRLSADNDKIKQNAEAEIKRIQGILDTVYGGKKGSKDDMEAAKKAIADYYSQMSLEEKEWLLNWEQERINGIENVYDRTIEQYELDEKRAMLEIEKFTIQRIKAQQELEKNEYAAKGGKGTFTPKTSSKEQLDEKTQAEITSREKAAQELRLKNEQDFFKSILSEHKTNIQEREDIVKKYAITEKYFNEQTNKAIESQNNELAEKGKIALSQLQINRRNELAKIDESMLKSSSIMKRMFAETSAISKKELKSLHKEAQDFVDIFNGDWSDDYTTLFPGITKELFDEIKDTENNTKLKDMRNNVYRLGKETEGALNAFTKLGKQLKALFKKDQSPEEFNSNLQGVLSTVGGISSALGDVASQMREFAELSGNKQFAEFAEVMERTTRSINATAQGAAVGASLGGAGGAAIGAIAGAGMDVISQIYEVKAAKEAKIQQFEAERLNFLYEYKKSILDIKEEDFTSIFGNTNFDQYIDAQRNALKEYEKEVKNWQYKARMDTMNYLSGEKYRMHFLGIGGRHSDAAQDLSNTVQDRRNSGAKYAALGNILINPEGKGDEMKLLYDEYSEMFTNENGEKGLDFFNVENAKLFLETQTSITDNSRRAIQSQIDFAEAQKELLNDLNDYSSDMFNNLGSSMSNAVVEAAINGTNAWEDFGDSVDAVFKNIISQQIQSRFIDGYLAQFDKKTKKLNEQYSNDGDWDKYAEGQKDIMLEMSGGLKPLLIEAQNFTKTLINDLAGQGVDLRSNDQTSNANKNKGFAAMSQDSANELNGRFTAIQAHTSAINANVSRMIANSDNTFAISKTISEQNAQLAANSSEALRRLAGIETNTAHLQKISENIATMNRNIDEINYLGVKSK